MPVGHQTLLGNVQIEPFILKVEGDPHDRRVPRSSDGILEA
jgi:hypothetical protein